MITGEWGFGMNNHTYIKIGEHREYRSCRFCLSKNIKEVLNLGNVPLAGGFIHSNAKKSDFLNENFYPLSVSFCTDCFLLQVVSAIDSDTLFKEYFYFSSSIATLLEHFDKNVDEIDLFFSNSNNIFVVEIGCNDGGFITALKNKGIRSVGIDPASNVVKPLIKKGLPIINDYFTIKTANKIVKTHGKADAIYSFHSMAHIEDMHEVIKGIKLLLKGDGYLAFEVHYLGSLIRNKQYDMIYHEHQYYYSLLSLQKFFALYDMEVFDIKQVDIRGGSIMYYVQNMEGGSRKISHRVKNLAKTERRLGFDKFAMYKNYAKEVMKTKSDLLSLLRKLKKQGKSIAGYGASGRGTVIMNYCNLDKLYLDFVIDDAPAKHNAYTPGTHLKIVSSEVLKHKDRPDYVVLFAWPFIKEIKRRNKEYLKSGGKIIVPLPNVTVIS